jgi:catechol 2,3-dioxygenase-like lactoylglutathione lyase family enzyme
MKIKSIAHICIKAKDLEATKHFYCDLLGFEKVFDFTKEGRVSGFYFEVGNKNFVEVFEGKGTENNSPQILHMCFETDDVKGLKKMLDSKKVKTTQIKLGVDNSYQFWVKDPDGIDIEFLEYTDKSSQFTKQNVEMNW